MSFQIMYHQVGGWLLKYLLYLSLVLMSFINHSYL